MRFVQRVLSLALIAGVLLAGATADAQQEKPQLPPRARASGKQKPPSADLQTHRFWDRENIELFAGVAAVRALDFTSTRHFRARGVDEALLSNSIVDNKPLFAGIEAAAAAASIGVSYLLHRKNHHKLERWVSIVHIGVAGFGDVRNYTLKNSNPVP